MEKSERGTTGDPIPSHMFAARERERECLFSKRIELRAPRELVYFSILIYPEQVSSLVACIACKQLNSPLFEDGWHEGLILYKNCYHILVPTLRNDRGLRFPLGYTSFKCYSAAYGILVFRWYRNIQVGTPSTGWYFKQYRTLDRIFCFFLDTICPANKMDNFVTK